MSCSPIQHEYIKKFNASFPEIDEVIIVVEYLSLKDDLKGYWNFYEELNLYHQDVLFGIASDIAKKKGYSVSEKYLKTSGLILDREFHVDHYFKKDKQELPISPPYIIRSMGLDDDIIMGIESLLAALNAPVSDVMSELRPFIKNNFKQTVSTINVPDNRAFLILQSYHPKISPLLNIGFGIDPFADPFVEFGGNNVRPTSHAYLVHKGSGDLLWSNKTSQISTKNQDKFFFGMPANNTSLQSNN